MKEKIFFAQVAFEDQFNLPEEQYLPVIILRFSASKFNLRTGHRSSFATRICFELMPSDEFDRIKICTFGRWRDVGAMFHWM